MSEYSRSEGYAFEAALRILPPCASEYFRAQLHRGCALARHPYTPPTNRYWDDQNFIVDWDEDSLRGGVDEVGVVLSGAFDVRQITMCLSKYDQKTLGRDFYDGDTSHQVKGGVVEFEGGGIKVWRRYFEGDTIDVDVIDLVSNKGHSNIFTGTKSMWDDVVNIIREEYLKEEQQLPRTFIINTEDMVRCGITKYPTWNWVNRYYKG